MPAYGGPYVPHNALYRHSSAGTVRSYAVAPNMGGEEASFGKHVMHIFAPNGRVLQTTPKMGGRRKARWQGRLMWPASHVLGEDREDLYNHALYGREKEVSLIAHSFGKRVCSTIAH